MATLTITSIRVNLWGAAMSDDDVCPGPRLCGAAVSPTEHFDLTADDSQDECLADGMPSCEMACPCRTSTPHRVKIGYTARRWPVRRRGTCDARHTTQEHKENRTPTRRELQILGGRIGLFVEWADYIETEGGTLEEQRLEYRELLVKWRYTRRSSTELNWNATTIGQPLPGGSMTRRRTRSVNCAFSEKEHVGSY